MAAADSSLGLNTVGLSATRRDLPG